MGRPIPFAFLSVLLYLEIVHLMAPDQSVNTICINNGRITSPVRIRAQIGPLLITRNNNTTATVEQDADMNT